MGQKISVLMATLNGAPFLEAQLRSIARQTRPPDQLLISDDGSVDQTKDLVAAFAIAHPWIEVVPLVGPGMGPAANFLSLLRRSPPDADAFFSRIRMTSGIRRRLSGRSGTFPKPEDRLFMVAAVW